MQIVDHGSLVAFTPTTEQEYQWMCENLSIESWQWLGRALQVDHRMADDLIEVMKEEGIEVQHA